jgi:S1-C subfamily serine protease
MTMALIAAGLFATGASAQDCSTVIKQHRLATVKIEAEATVKSTGAIIGAAGTGVVISELGYVLTNSHIVNLGNDVEDVRITGRIGSSKAPAESLQFIDDDTTHDLALLRIENTARSYQAVRLGNIAIARDGTAVCSMGYPKDLEFHPSQGMLGGPSDQGGWLTLTIPTNPGESGAPVFTPQGRLLGLRVAGRTDLVGVYYMVPLNLAARLLALVPGGPGTQNDDNSIFAMQLDDRPSVVGRTFTVDLGFVEGGKTVSVPLAVRLASGKGRYTLGPVPSPLSIVSETGGGDIEMAADRPVKLTLKLDNPARDVLQEKEMRLLIPVEGSSGTRQALTLVVRWHALEGTVKVAASSGPKASGRGAELSPPYEVCAASPVVGDYVYVPKSGTHSLSGDRGCGAWSNCNPRSEEKRYCLVFELQGHNECLGFLDTCAPVRNSEGHVAAVFQLRPSIPRLIATM